jgi:hypothetical protein
MRSGLEQGILRLRRIGRLRADSALVRAGGSRASLGCAVFILAPSDVVDDHDVVAVTPSA